jgi:hypothetical protein
MNIVEMILQALSGDTLTKLAATIGESPESVKKALAAIVPTLLAGIGGLAAKPEKAEKLWSSLKSVDPKVSEDLGGVLAGGADELQKKGTNILEDLLGKQSLAALIVPIAKFLAGNTDLVKKLLPLVAPFLLSFLGKQAKSGGLDLAGLLKLLLSQKSNISKAIPGDLAKSLTGIQGLSDLTSFATDATQSAVKAAGDAAEGSKNMLVPIIAVLGLLGAGYWIFTQMQPTPKLDEEKARRDATATMDQMKTKMGGPEAQAPSADSVDPMESLTKNFTEYFGSIGKSLDGITDEATAKAAVPGLEEMSTRFNQLKAVVDTLPESAREGLTGMLQASQKTLTEKTEKVLGIPGVGELLKPLLEGILEKLAALLKA